MEKLFEEKRAQDTRGFKGFEKELIELDEEGLEWLEAEEIEFDEQEKRRVYKGWIKR